MKRIRPTTLTIASILLVLTMLAGFALPTLFPQLGFAAAAGRFQPNGQGNLPNGQNFEGRTPPGDFGGGGFNGGGGRTGGRGDFGGGRQFGGGGPLGGANPLGAVGSSTTTNSMVLIGLQVGLSILRIVFVGLGLLAAYGLFRMRKWGLVLSIVLLVFSIVGFFIPQNTLFRLALPLMGIGAASQGTNFGLANLFTFNLFRFNWVNLIEPVGLMAVTVLALLPASRKAMAPITDENLIDEEAEENSTSPIEAASSGEMPDSSSQTPQSENLTA